MPYILTKAKGAESQCGRLVGPGRSYGPMKIYELLEKNDPEHLNYLVAGPWNHGGWGRSSGKSLGRHPFRQRHLASISAKKLKRPWFAYWLKDKGSLPLKEALLFQTGSDKWVQFDSWPPQRCADTRTVLP